MRYRASTWAVGAIGLAALAARRALSASDAVESEQRHALPLAAGETLHLETANGGIAVDAWDRDEVELVAFCRASARGREQAEQALAAVSVEVERAESGVRAHAAVPDPSLVDRLVHGASDARVSWRVRVPRGARIHLASDNGRIAVHGVSGGVVIESGNGPLEIQETTGPVEATTGNGRVVFTASRWTAGAAISLATDNGRVKVRLPTDAGVDLVATTDDGMVRLYGTNGTSGVARHRERLEMRLGDGGTPVRLHTGHGDVRVERFGG